tara:strand:- start:300 stop:1223 length:924 start_codon:yes stop_codon:yes gene_type:complete
MIGSFYFTPVAGSIQTALSQPIFPGKVVMWLLFMLSIVSWVMLISKAFQLRKTYQADQKFGKRLRESRSTLEVFEEGRKISHSLQQVVYLAGAREAAFQLLGSREPHDGMQDDVAQAGQMTERQAVALRQSFLGGLRTAETQLESGMSGFRLISVSACLLGLIGFVWTLMSGMDSASSSAEVMPAIGSSLGFLAVALMVATPAILARIGFGIQQRRRLNELKKFHDDIVRLFERKFCNEGEIISDRLAKESPIMSEPGDDDSSPDGTGKKQYHSIRERLLRPPSDSGVLDQLQINPIAKQAASIRSL